MSNSSSPNKPIRLESTGSNGSGFSQTSQSRPPTNQSEGSITPSNHSRGLVKQSSGSVTPSSYRNGTTNLSARSSQNFDLIGSPDRLQKIGNGGLDVTSTNINMEFEKSPAKPTGKLKGKSIAENRRRITMLLGKKWWRLSVILSLWPAAGTEHICHTRRYTCSTIGEWRRNLTINQKFGSFSNLWFIKQDHITGMDSSHDSAGLMYSFRSWIHMWYAVNRLCTYSILNLFVSNCIYSAFWWKELLYCNLFTQH